METNTSPTSVVSRNGTSAGSLAGRNRQAFTLVQCRFWSQRSGGSTLIELLVVIAIISVLIGLIVDTEPWGEAEQIKCLSQLKNLGTVVQLYINDHGGRFPDITDFRQVPQKVNEALKPCVDSEEIFWCPGEPEKSTHPGGSYEWRVTHDPKTSIAGVRLDLLRHPNRVIIAGERAPDIHEKGMINVLYADGHVDQVTEEEWWENITTPLDSL